MTDSTDDWAEKREAMQKVMNARDWDFMDRDETAERFRLAVNRDMRNLRILGWCFALFPLCALAFVVWRILRN